MIILTTTEAVVLVDSDLAADHCGIVWFARMAYTGISFCESVLLRKTCLVLSLGENARQVIVLHQDGYDMVKVFP